MAEAHIFPLRVYYEDTDAAGIVYYANYLKFAERARTEMLRAHGVAQRLLMRESGVGFAVRRCEVEYFAPAFLDDRLEIHTRLTAVRGASVEAEQTVRRLAARLAELRVRVACVDRDGRPARLPAAIAKALKNATVTPSFSRKIGSIGKRESNG